MKTNSNGQKVHEKIPNITKCQEYANQNQNIISHLLKWLSSKSQEILSVDKSREKEPLNTVGENVNNSETMENNMELP